MKKMMVGLVMMDAEESEDPAPEIEQIHRTSIQPINMAGKGPDTVVSFGKGRLRISCVIGSLKNCFP